MVPNSLGKNKLGKKFQKKYFFYAKTGIKPEKLDPKSQNKNSPKVFDTRYRTPKKK